MNLYRKIVLSVIASSSILTTYSQSKTEGAQLYNTLAFDKAISIYKKELQHKPDNYEATFALATCYRVNGRYAAAEEWYRKSLDLQTSINAKLSMIQMMQINKKYKEAAPMMEDIADVMNSESAILCMRSMATFTKSLGQGKYLKNIYNIRAVNFNSEQLDFSPTFFKDGIVFASNRKPSNKKLDREDDWTSENFTDIYYAKGKEAIFDAPILFADLNGSFHDGPICFNKSGNTAIFTRSDKTGNDEAGNSRLSLYEIKFDENSREWSKPVRLNISNKFYSIAHPYLSVDGNTLYFASDKPGGLGGTDIYYSSKSELGWEEPVNCGEEINTPGNEKFPYISNDGTLYFASDWHPGYGGLDIFKAKKQGSTYISIENVGFGVNSSLDDFGLILNNDGQSGYFTSSRGGADDVFSFRLKPRFFIRGYVSNCSEKNILKNAKVYLKNDEIIVDSAITNAKGEFEFEVEVDNNYEIEAYKKGFIPSERCDSKGEVSTSNLKTSKTFELDLGIEKPKKLNAKGELVDIDLIEIESPTASYPISPPTTIELYNIYFDLDKDYIRDDARPDLDTLVSLLNRYPTMKGTIEAFTDARNTGPYNFDLSNRRAKNAVAYVVLRGINPARINFKGNGETRPRNSCVDGVMCTEMEHQRNRRIEFTITEFPGGTITSKEYDYFIRGNQR